VAFRGFAKSTPESKHGRSSWLHTVRRGCDRCGEQKDLLVSPSESYNIGVTHIKIFERKRDCVYWCKALLDKSHKCSRNKVNKDNNKKTMTDNENWGIFQEQRKIGDKWKERERKREGKERQNDQEEKEMCM
jgi:hypothetical protein